MDTLEVKKVTLAGREAEYLKISESFENSRNGMSQVILITGRSGAGKTTLIRYFLNQIRLDDETFPTLFEGVPDTIIGYESCQYSESFSSFFRILASINEQYLNSIEKLNKDSKNKVKNVFVHSLKFISDVGPDAVAYFIPLIGLILKFVMFPVKVLLDKVDTNVVNPSKFIIQETEQIYENYWRILYAAGEISPIIIVLDELHKADIGTLRLFFYLATQIKRAKNTKILLIGCFRSGKIDEIKSGEKHPIKELFFEFKAKQSNWDSIWIDLDQTIGGNSGKKFIDGLIDKIPNNLSKEFREKLFHLTQGYAQFAVDLLYFFQERSYLKIDEKGQLVQVKKVNFDELPNTIEALIEERIERLEKELKDILTCASVEGEEFTAEVIARINKVERLNLFKKLDEELEKKHKFISPFEKKELEDGTKLHLYNFTINLHQQYIYNKLGENYRKELHKRVGEVLEILYKKEANKIVSQLARHFMEAEEITKAVKYSILSAKKAEDVYAFEDAVNYYKQAEMMISKNRNLQLNTERYSIYASLIDIFSTQGKKDLAKEEIAKLRQLVEGVFKNNDEILIKMKLLIAENSILISDFNLAKEFGKEALRLAKNINNKTYVAKAYLILGEAYIYLAGNHDIAQKYLEASLDFYESENDLSQIAKNQHLIALLNLKRSNFELAELYAKKSLKIYEEIGDKIGENTVLRYLGDIFCAQGDYVEGLKKYRKVYRIRREIGQKVREGGALGDIGDVYLELGFYEKSLDLHEKSLQINEDVGYKYGQVWCHHDMGLIYYNLALNAENEHQYLVRMRQSCDEISNAITIAKEIKEKDLLAMCQNSLSLSFIELSKKLDENIYLSKALKLTEESIQTSRQASFISREIVGICYQALAYFCMGEVETALEKSNYGIELLEKRLVTFELLKEEIYFIHSEILGANKMAEQSYKFLKKSQKEVARKAEKIKFNRLRTSFLNQVPINRRIIGKGN